MTTNPSAELCAGNQNSRSRSKHFVIVKIVVGHSCCWFGKVRYLCRRWSWRHLWPLENSASCGVGHEGWGDVHGWNRW